MIHQRHAFQADAPAVPDSIDQAINNALDNRVPYLSPTELVAGSTKQTVVEDVIVTVLEGRIGNADAPIIRPHDIRGVVSDRYDSYALRKICGLECGTEEFKGFGGFLRALAY